MSPGRTSFAVINPVRASYAPRQHSTNRSLFPCDVSSALSPASTSDTSPVAASPQAISYWTSQGSRFSIRRRDGVVPRPGATTGAVHEQFAVCRRAAQRSGRCSAVARLSPHARPPRRQSSHHGGPRDEPALVAALKAGHEWAFETLIGSTAAACSPWPGASPGTRRTRRTSCKRPT